MNLIENKTILITGAAGFIGARTCEVLAENNLLIVAIDNFDPYYDVRLKQSRWDKLAKFQNVQRLEMDVTDVQELEKLFERFAFDAVINLAAMAGVRYSIENPMKYFQVNTSGIVGLLEIMRKKGVRQLIQASTSSLYAGLPMPFEETLDVRRPISPYAASKLGAEGICYTYAQLYSLDVTVLRFFTVYGPAGRPDMAPYRFIEWSLRREEIKIFGNGQQSRDFTYVDDIALGIISALRNRLSGFEIINLGGGGERISILKMVHIIGEIVGLEPNVKFLPIAEGDMEHTSASIDKAQRMLNWSPRVSFSEGIAETIKDHLLKFGT